MKRSHYLAAAPYLVGSLVSFTLDADSPACGFRTGLVRSQRKGRLRVQFPSDVDAATRDARYQGPRHSVDVERVINVRPPRARTFTQSLAAFVEEHAPDTEEDS